MLEYKTILMVSPSLLNAQWFFNVEMWLWYLAGVRKLQEYIC
jgi:hypothetical protein